MDALIGVENAVRDWQSVIKNSVDVSADLLKRCGLWGCLLSAIVSSNIAQYDLYSLLMIKARFPLPELTGDRFPLPVNTGRVDGRAFPLSTRLVETGLNSVNVTQYLLYI